MNKLRFAPIIRVSTEKQAKKGESLHTQKTQILQAVANLGGEIPEHCWQYSGQEHATPDQERIKLTQLLDDSSKGIFDCVIVADPSRWSRDNKKSKEGLDILKKNKIRFFELTKEFDLYSPNDAFLMGMFTEINQMIAAIQNKKSIENRIERAKKGSPTSGSLPYGRTFDKATNTWGVDTKKLLLIQNAAERYLKGEATRSIANSLDINESFLRHTLTHSCSNIWECRFKNKDCNIDETVMMEVPRLLDDKTIAAIKEKCRNNIVSVRGNRKYEYLLSGHIYCSRCGYMMSGYTSNRIKPYYRHSQYHNAKSCDFHKRVPAVDIENRVLWELVKTLGDPQQLAKAIERATPNNEQRDLFIAEKKELEIKLKKEISIKDKIIEAFTEGLFGKNEIEKRLEKVRENEKAINSRLQIIENSLSAMPSPEHIKKASVFIGRVAQDAARHNPKIIFDKSVKWKKDLLEKAFSGVAPDNKRFGVYVDWIDGKFTFEIKGHIIVEKRELDDDEEFNISKMVGIHPTARPQFCKATAPFLSNI